MKIKIISSSSPENPATGYGDALVLFDDQDRERARWLCSVCPNPYKPGTDPKVPWDQAYGWIAPGIYSWTVYESPKYKKCLLINGGGECRSRIPNVNHEGREILTNVLAHQGGLHCKNPDWRGSAGCITLHREVWIDFINHFRTGDQGELEIVEPDRKGGTVGLLGEFKVLKGMVKAGTAATVAGLATAGATAMSPAIMDAVQPAADAVTAAAPAALVGSPDIPTTALVAVGTWLIKLLVDWIKHR